MHGASPRPQDRRRAVHCVPCCRADARRDDASVRPPVHRRGPCFRTAGVLASPPRGCPPRWLPASCRPPPPPVPLLSLRHRITGQAADRAAERQASTAPGTNWQGVAAPAVPVPVPVTAFGAAGTWPPVIRTTVPNPHPSISVAVPPAARHVPQPVCSPKATSGELLRGVGDCGGPPATQQRSCCVHPAAIGLRCTSRPLRQPWRPYLPVLTKTSTTTDLSCRGFSSNCCDDMTDHMSVVSKLVILPTLQHSMPLDPAPVIVSVSVPPVVPVSLRPISPVSLPVALATAAAAALTLQPAPFLSPALPHAAGAADYDHLHPPAAPAAVSL